MSSAGTAYVDVEAKLDELGAQVEAAVSAIETQTVDVEADVSAAQSEIESIDGGSTEITVEANTEQAQANVDDLSGSVSGLMDSLGGEGGPGGAVGGFAEAAGLLGASSMSAATGGVAALGVGLGYASSEAMEAEAVLAQLDQMVANVGANAGVSSPALQAMATDIQETAGFSDEAVMSGQAMVLMFENVRNVAGQPIFDRTIAASADLARSPAFNGDITNAARTLGRALDDPTAGMGRLRRAGIQLTEGQQEEIRSLQENGDMLGAQAALLDIVEGKVNGLADAYGETLAGSLDKTKEKLGENAEQIGGIVLPVINEVVGAFADVMDASYDLGFALGEAFQGRLFTGTDMIAGVGTVVGELPASLTAAADGMDDFSTAAADASDSVLRLDDRVRAYIDGVFRVPEAQRALRDSFADLGETLADPARTADDVAVSLQDIVTNAAAVGIATGDMSGAVDVAVYGLAGLQAQGKLSAAEVAEVKSQLESLPGNTEANVSTPGATTSRTQVSTLTDALLGVPPDVESQVSAEGLSGVYSTTVNYRRELDQLDGRQVTSYVGIVTTGSAKTSAVGGPLRSGELSLVGEEGPELFVPNTGGNIVPAMETASLMMGKGATYNITVNAPSGNGADIARVIREELINLERASR